MEEVNITNGTTMMTFKVPTINVRKTKLFAKGYKMQRFVTNETQTVSGLIEILKGFPQYLPIKVSGRESGIEIHIEEPSCENNANNESTEQVVIIT